uniref:Protein kinase domain-containing protein n=1 Tax=Ananas comosus var. bracteatus TaxID=296719 RepID=A0A6V7PS29_ANACO|nr:unnamed protein product [Ananas comosus var. bracteatus]
MGCFPCFGSSHEGEEGKGGGERERRCEEGCVGGAIVSPHSRISSDKFEVAERFGTPRRRIGPKEESTAHIAAQTFTFRELAAAEELPARLPLGRGRFLPCLKGRLEGEQQVVAVKQLDRNGLQGNREFLSTLLVIVRTVDQRLLVYEFMPLGSLEDHLHDVPPDKEPLDWNTRMKIAAVSVWFSLNSSRGGSIDNTRLPESKILLHGPVHYSRTEGSSPRWLIHCSKTAFLEGTISSLCYCSMCLQEQAATRPLIGDVVTALSYLASQTHNPNAASVQSTRSGPSTPRVREDRRNIRLPDAQNSVQSPNPNSPDLRRKESLKGANSGADSGRKSGLDESEMQEFQYGSPVHARKNRETQEILTGSGLLQRPNYGGRIGERGSRLTHGVLTALTVRM